MALNLNTAQCKTVINSDLKQTLGSFSDPNLCGVNSELVIRINYLMIQLLTPPTIVHY